MKCSRAPTYLRDDFFQKITKHISMHSKVLKVSITKVLYLPFLGWRDYKNDGTVSHATFIRKFVCYIYQVRTGARRFSDGEFKIFLFELSILVSVEKLLATYPVCYTIHLREYRNTRPVSGLNTLKPI